MRILVTGASGVIGQTLVAKLFQTGARLGRGQLVGAGEALQRQVLAHPRAAQQAPQPVAQRIGERALNLPSGVCLRRSQVDYVCRCLREILS